MRPLFQACQLAFVARTQGLSSFASHAVQAVALLSLFIKSHFPKIPLYHSPQFEKSHAPKKTFSEIPLSQNLTFLNPNISISQYIYVPISLYSNISMSQYLCIPISLYLNISISRYLYILISLYPNMSISQYPYITIHHYPNIPQYPNILLSRYPNIPTSRYPNIFISLYTVMVL